jgi:hypothetical protein
MLGMTRQVRGFEDPAHAQRRQTVAVSPVANSDVRSTVPTTEVSDLLGAFDSLDERLEGRRGLLGVQELEPRLEHHPVEVRVGRGVLEVDDAEDSEMAHRVTRDNDVGESIRQPGETLLADRAPESGHAVEVRIQRGGGHAAGANQRRSGDGLAVGKHRRRPLDEGATNLRRARARHLDNIV